MGLNLVPFSTVSASATTFCILVIISSINCQESRIIGGEFTLPGEFPHQVAVLIRIGAVTNVKLCGGSILSPDYILTAGHCLIQTQPDRVKIVAGKHDITGPGPGLYDNPGIMAKQLIFHPCFNQSGEIRADEFLFFNDIAIIKLDGLLTMGNLVKEINIDDKDLAQDGKIAQAIGWGRTHQEQSTPAYSPLLKKAKLTLNTTGWNKGKFSSSLQEGQVVASNPDAFTCQGDSGGPLLCDDGSGSTNVVCGIGSFVEGQNPSVGQCFGPTVFTRVFHYRQWIRNVLNGNYDSNEGCIPTTENDQYEYYETSCGFPSDHPNYFVCRIFLVLVFLLA